MKPWMFLCTALCAHLLFAEQAYSEIVSNESLAEPGELELLLDLDSDFTAQPLLVTQGEECHAGPGNNPTSRACGTEHPRLREVAARIGLDLRAKPGSCHYQNGQSDKTPYYGVIFTVVGAERECRIACAYTPPPGSSRKGAKCTCVVFSCTPEVPQEEGDAPLLPYYF